MKVTLLFNKLICVVFVLTFVVGIFWGVYNFNLLIISFFMFISILEPKKLSSYNYISFKTFSFKKKKSIKFILVKSDDFLYKVVSKMNKFKFNIFYILYPNSKTKVITENSLNNFCLVYEPTVRLCEIKELV